jgi:hypothetical protein
MILQMSGSPRSPEETLWRAVIEQHLRDALSLNKQRDEQRLRNEARKWFKQRDATYRYVCELAGFDPDELADKALALFEQTDRKRAAPGVVPDFQVRSRTGGGSDAQDSAKLEFS